MQINKLHESNASLESKEGSQELKLNFGDIYPNKSDIIISKNGNKMLEKHEDKFTEKKMTTEKSYATTAIVTEFLHKLFPGRSIFMKKSNVVEIVSVHHDYFSMFIGSTQSRTRLIRFCNLIALLLTSIFADTVFFGIFFPHDSTCTQQTDKVSSI